MMSAGELGRPSTVTPVASVWCRQVDNEAESPGYTAIPDEFPGRLEALEAIRLVGHLTINVADTHDYWDPNPSQTLSFYPNMFLYPAAGGRYTCVGRMFLSTEDRPRLGMKTLVFPTEELVQTGDFGGSVLRAHATMVGRDEPRRPRAEPDTAAFQAVGEGFLFHRGATDPVIVVASSEEWEAASQAANALIAAMPAALVALGAFLVFPYFLPAPKVNLREFTEQLPLALAVMRVPRQEAEGERHARRMQSWQTQSVSVRDLSRPTPPRSKEGLPLVLQYVRDHADEKTAEVARRVDQVEAPRLAGALADAEAPTGRERRKEMWRIGTAMETAAMLLARPRGKTVAVSGETAKRANEYLEARPGESPMLTAPVAEAPVAAASAATAAAAAVPATNAGAPPNLAAPSAPTGTPAAPSASAPAPPSTARADARLPQWLRPPPQIAVPKEAPGSVPVSTSDDSSLHPPAAPSPVPPPEAARAPVGPGAGPRTGEGVTTVLPTAAERGLWDARISLATRELERRWTATLDSRLREATDSFVRTAESLRTGLDARLAELERRPAPAPGPQASELEAALTAKFDSKLAGIDSHVSEAVRATAEGWAERFRREIKEASEELSALTAKSEEDLRAALVAQLDLELLEAKEQGNSLREQIEASVRSILDTRLTEGEERRGREMRELEQRVGLLVDGRTRDAEEHLTSSLGTEARKLAAESEERLGHLERRVTVERDARLEELAEAQRAAVAGLQVRMQSFIEQKLRETQAAEQEKYVELLARLKAELEGTLATTLGSAEFDARLRERIAREVEGATAEQREAFVRSLGESREALTKFSALEEKVASREGDLAALETKLREELTEIDRRVMVVNDHVLPIVRQTWLKLSESEGALRTKATEAQLVALKQELTAALQRLQQESDDQFADLRELIETNVQSHGRIWLNYLRQYSPDSAGFPAPATPAGTHRVSRRPTRVPVSSPAATASVEEGPPFASDPPNPMDPTLADDASPKPPRRRSRKSGA
jgi:hypothetical protein